MLEVEIDVLHLLDDGLGLGKGIFGEIADDGIALRAGDDHGRVEMVQNGIEKRVQDFFGMVQFGLRQELGIAGDIGDE